MMDKKQQQQQKKNLVHFSQFIIFPSIAGTSIKEKIYFIE